MALVQESLIDVFNRRFVNCHYNAFPAAGYDADAALFAEKIKKSGKTLRYGAILTPNGELVVSFGFDMNEFHRALKASLEKRPEYAGMSDDEARTIRRAENLPDDMPAQFDAVELYAKILRFDKAHAFLNRLLDRELSSGDAAPAHYLKGHYALIDLDNRDEETIRSEFASIKDVPDELADDIAMDLIELDIELTPAQGFFTGWRFQEDCDLAATRKMLEKWIEDAPDSNRVGRMHFLLGLARMNDGDKKGANAVWSKHVNDYPEDRFAMLSRIHHTDYQFSPNGPRAKSLVRMQMNGDGPVTAVMFKSLKKMVIQGGENLDAETRTKLVEKFKRKLGEQLVKQLEQKLHEMSGEQSERAAADHAKGEKKESKKTDDEP